MVIADSLPTVFASVLGIEFKILFKRKKNMSSRKTDVYNDRIERLQYFQQMAITSSFEDCIAVYFGIDLTKKQIDVLKLIHRTTKPWLSGHVVGVCIKRIESSNTQNKDFSESVRILVEQLEKSEGKLIGKRMKGILVHSTRTEAQNR